MTAREYQLLAARTLIDAPDFQLTDEQVMIAWNVIGLAGEAGEVAETVKKGIFHQHGLDRDKMHKELGDVLWYVAALCTRLGFDMDDIMAANIAKLKKRYPNGYNTGDSIARVDESAPHPDEYQQQVQKEDPTRFVGNCTCRIAGVVQTSATDAQIMLGGVDDCPVHGFGE